MNTEIWDFSGRAAVVTGGTRGIGRSISEELLLRGAEVHNTIVADDNDTDVNTVIAIDLSNRVDYAPAADNGTWKRFGAVRFKQFLKASRCQLSNSFRQIGQSVIGTELVAMVKTENSDQYGPQNRVGRYAARGEVDTQAKPARPQATNSAAGPPKGVATASGGGFE